MKNIENQATPNQATPNTQYEVTIKFRIDCGSLPPDGSWIEGYKEWYKRSITGENADYQGQGDNQYIGGFDIQVKPIGEEK